MPLSRDQSNSPERLIGKAVVDGIAAARVNDAITDDDVLAALSSQMAHNPDGATVIDALIGLGVYEQTQAALERLLAAGKLRRGNGTGTYIPAFQLANRQEPGA